MMVGPCARHARQCLCSARIAARYAAMNTGFFIQVGTFAREENALGMVDRMSDEDGPQVMEVSINGKKFYRVMVGPYESRGSAKNMLSKLASIGIPDAKIIHN